MQFHGNASVFLGRAALPRRQDVEAKRQLCATSF